MSNRTNLTVKNKFKADGIHVDVDAEGRSKERVEKGFPKDFELDGEKKVKLTASDDNSENPSHLYFDIESTDFAHLEISKKKNTWTLKTKKGTPPPSGDPKINVSLSDNEPDS